MIYFYNIGRYFLMLGQVFRKPQKRSVFHENIFKEIEELGLKSIGIVAFISFFVGGVVAIQTGLNVDNPWIPKYLIGFATKRSIILEFAPTFMSVILAGKVGSYITSSMGTMRVTEQIDALEVMGVNTLNYLILPKIVAAMIYFPILIVFSMLLGLFGGWVAGVFSGLVPSDDFILGLRSWFNPFSITYAIIKTVVFAIIITSISGFMGYTVKGGSVEVGQNSTKAVVYSSILIIVWDLILTQLLLV